MPRHMTWVCDHVLTLVLMTLFLVFLGGQLLMGHAEHNSTRRAWRGSPESKPVHAPHHETGR